MGKKKGRGAKARQNDGRGYSTTSTSSVRETPPPTPAASDPPPAPAPSPPPPPTKNDPPKPKKENDDDPPPPPPPPPPVGVESGRGGTTAPGASAGLRLRLPPPPRGAAATDGSRTSTSIIPNDANSADPTTTQRVTISAAAHDGLGGLVERLRDFHRDDDADAADDEHGDLVIPEAVLNSAKFVNNVASLGDRLNRIGFDDERIGQAVRGILLGRLSERQRRLEEPKQSRGGNGGRDGASSSGGGGGIGVGANVSVEDALDWLCLRLPSEELPPALTEWTVRESARSARQQRRGDISVEIHGSAGKAGTEEDGAVQHGHGRDFFPTGDAVGRREGEDERQERPMDKSPDVDKAWLLERYAYEEDDGGGEEGADDGGGSEQCAGGVAAIDSSPACAAVVAERTPEEVELSRLEREIAGEEASLNDEASNYVRSKYETKELRKEVNQMKRRAKMLRAKVAKAKAKREAEEQAAPAPAAAAAASPIVEDDGGAAAKPVRELGNATGEEDEDEGAAAGLFPIFDEGSASASTNCPAAPSPVETSRAASTSVSSTPPPSVPKDWTGKTPKTILHEWCQKRKLPPPKYQRLKHGHKHGCSITVKRGKDKADAGSDVVLERPGPYHSFADAQNYLATESLYELNPTLPLYRVLPPSFRRMWQSWLEDVSASQEAERYQLEEDRMRKAQGLINTIRGNAAATPPNGNSDSHLETQKHNGEELHENQVPLLDNWDDEDGSVEEDEQRQPPQSMSSRKDDAKSAALGESLRAEFEARRQSAAYKRMAAARHTLPIAAHRQFVLDTISENRVTVLCGETGCGKSTQCPQYLLEDALRSGMGSKVSIICTQPRRISAMSLGERVAEEMVTKLGGQVGYQIRMESKKTHKTKLLFCTTGVIVKRLQEDPNLSNVTHVIVDEVHERQWQIDFLLIALRKLINTTRKDLKVILMSATLDAKLFCDFFGGAPLVSVPGRTFPVSEYYLEDILDATGHLIEEGSPYAFREDPDGEEATLWVTGRGGARRKEIVSLSTGCASSSTTTTAEVSSGYKKSTIMSMQRVNERIINYDLIEDVLQLLLISPEENYVLTPPEQSDGSALSCGATLVFLPGMGEIKTLRSRLSGSRMFGDASRFDIIPLHSSISPTDQKRAFLKSKKGCRKIILSTNLAETSVTLPDVVCVIDTGLVREVQLSKRSSTSTLVTIWASMANAKQRQGRAGRVQPGICLKLYSAHTASNVMKPQATPELQRVPLEEICLSILAGGASSDCNGFLQQAPEPPSEVAVNRSLLLLEDIGAIESQPDLGGAGDNISSLTALGRHLARFPLDVQLAKLLIFGSILGCLDKVLTITASLSCKSPFPTHVDDAQQAEAAHRTFFHASSDFLTTCTVFDGYESALNEGEGVAKRFCHKNFLNRGALVEIAATRKQLLRLLGDVGFVSRSVNEWNVKGSKYNAHGSKEKVVNAAICAGLYPNVAHAVKATSTGVPELYQKTERLYFHSSSVNNGKSNLTSNWVMFHEKFATRKVYIAATELATPYSLLLFGGRRVAVKHMERKVIIDDWIELGAGAKTGVMFREIRKGLDLLFKEMFESDVDGEESKAVLRGVIDVLLEEE